MSIRLILALLASLLFCTLATFEFPELLNLTDDTSNDYAIEVVQSTEGCAVRQQTADTPPKLSRASSRPDWMLTLAQFPAPPRRGAAFLRLLCVRRT